MRSAAGFRPFATWEGVLHAAGANAALYYWPPMNHQPVLICSYRVTGMNPKARIKIAKQGDNDSFYADAGHLDRFYTKEA